MKNAEVITVYLDLEPVPFNKGFYSVDMTFFFDVCVDVFCAPATGPIPVNGISIFNKKVILYGSEGNVKMFSSDYALDNVDEQATISKVLPKATCQKADHKRNFMRSQLRWHLEDADSLQPFLSFCISEFFQLRSLENLRQRLHNAEFYVWPYESGHNP